MFPLTSSRKIRRFRISRDVQFCNVPCSMPCLFCYSEVLDFEVLYFSDLQQAAKGWIDLGSRTVFPLEKFATCIQCCCFLHSWAVSAVEWYWYNNGNNIRLTAIFHYNLVSWYQNATRLEWVRFPIGHPKRSLWDCWNEECME